MYKDDCHWDKTKLMELAHITGEYIMKGKATKKNSAI